MKEWGALHRHANVSQRISIQVRSGCTLVVHILNCGPFIFGTADISNIVLRWRLIVLSNSLSLASLPVSWSQSPFLFDQLKSTRTSARCFLLLNGACLRSNAVKTTSGKKLYFKKKNSFSGLDWQRFPSVILSVHSVTPQPVETHEQIISDWTWLFMSYPRLVLLLFSQQY